MGAFDSDCSPAWRRLVSCHLDGELDELGTVRVNRHLAGCPACSAWADEASAVAGLMRSSELEEPDHALGPQRLRRRRARGMLLSASAASVAAAALMALALQPMTRGIFAGDRSQQATSSPFCGWCSPQHAVFLPQLDQPAVSLPQAHVHLNPVASA